MRPTAWIIGYHGCDKSTSESILSGGKEIQVSTNSHDWLGGGAYFWENSYSRALRWARYLKRHPEASKANSRISEPCVIGAIIDPGNCLDLCDDDSLELLKSIYPLFEKTLSYLGTKMPKNEPGFKGDRDLSKRSLDRAVIDYLHAVRRSRREIPFDSVRCPFTEGGPLFPKSRIQSRTHLQWCIRSPRSQILGYFKPRKPIREVDYEQA